MPRRWVQLQLYSIQLYVGDPLTTKVQEQLSTVENVGMVTSVKYKQLKQINEAANMSFI